NVLGEVPRWQLTRLSEERVNGRLRRTRPRHDLLEHRERDIVGELAELLDLFGCARLLTTEIVARETQHIERPTLHLALQLLETVILRGEPALARHIDDEAHFPPIHAEVRRFTHQRHRLHVVEGAHRTSRCRRRLSHHDRGYGYGGCQGQCQRWS